MSAGDSNIAAIRAAFEVIGRRLETLCAIGQLADVRLHRQVGPSPTIGRHTSAAKLLTEEQVAKIRAGVREGICGPVMLTWIEQLLAERDDLLRLARERGPEKGNPEGRPQMDRDGS